MRRRLSVEQWQGKDRKKSKGIIPKDTRSFTAVQAQNHCAVQPLFCSLPYANSETLILLKATAITARVGQGHSITNMFMLWLFHAVWYCMWRNMCRSNESSSPFIGQLPIQMADGEASAVTTFGAKNRAERISTWESRPTTATYSTARGTVEEKGCYQLGPSFQIFWGSHWIEKEKMTS